MNAFWILGAELLKLMMDYEVINRSVLIGMCICPYMFYLGLSMMLAIMSLWLLSAFNRYGMKYMYLSNEVVSMSLLGSQVISDEAFLVLPSYHFSRFTLLCWTQADTGTAIERL